MPQAAGMTLNCTMMRAPLLFLILLALIPALRADDAVTSDENVLKENKVGIDEKGLRDFFRKRTPTPEDQKEIDALVGQLGERSYARRQRATERLTAWRPAAFSALKKATTDADIEIVRRAERIIAEIERDGTELPIAAVRQLARKKSADASAILIAYFPNADDDIVGDAVLAALLALSNPKTMDPVLVRAAEDRSPARRVAAAHVLGRHPQQVGRDVAVKLLADPAPGVRYRAAEALLFARQKAAIPLLIALLGDAQVLPAGRVLVAELDGHRVTERDRKGKILWQHAVQTPIYCRRMSNGNTFISTNHACFVVTPAGKEVFRYSAEGGFFIHSIQQLPNHHIICISMNGAVREIGPDGMVIRTIPLQDCGSWSGIEGLPGNRYLCVGGGKVREIDASGKVLWRFDHPSACFATRLPSGNTLVVDYSRGLIEVTREGKIIWKRDLTTNLWRVHRR
jgi:hypothetical protein